MTLETVSIAANGLAFTADVTGPAGGGLVLLLHGFPQTRHTWRAELRALADAGFRACAPDQRGYSAGARPSGVDAYRVELLVADALAIAGALGADRFHLVGHDWGGQLAWLLAAQNPRRVRTLSVISRPHPAAFGMSTGPCARTLRRPSMISRISTSGNTPERRALISVRSAGGTRSSAASAPFPRRPRRDTSCSARCTDCGRAEAPGTPRRAPPPGRARRWQARPE